MIHAFGYFIGIYRINREKTAVSSAGVDELKDFPSVSILIPARHEPKQVLENTLISCYNIDYPNKTVYLLDDSSDEKYKKEAEELSKQYGARLFRRTEPWHGAKAGIINDCLKTLSDEYMAVFDADQNPMPDFLVKLIPILEGNPKLAFVQTPQFYSNLDSNKIAFSSNMQQAVFYEYVCEGKNSGQAMICCGTNVIFRREALMDVRGLDESTVTEDFATSFKLHAKGWKSLYYNHVHVFGMGPEDIGSYFKQQNRWALGNVGVLRVIITKFLTRPFALGLTQWFEYLITGSYYLIGWAYLFLVLCPITYIFFNIPSFFMNPIVYGLTFTPYLMLSLAIFYKSMLVRYYTAKDIFKVQILAFTTLPIYIRASLFGFLGVKGTFQVTSKGTVDRISYFKLWPQLAFWGLCLAAITWGLNRFAYERTASSIINVLWITYHFILFSGIFYFNELESQTMTCKSLKKGVIFEYEVLKEPYHVERLGAETWKTSFTVFLPERLNKGTFIMCKTKQAGKDVIIFDGNILESSEQKSRRGFKTAIGVFTISEKDKGRLREAIKS